MLFKKFAHQVSDSPRGNRPGRRRHRRGNPLPAIAHQVSDPPRKRPSSRSPPQASPERRPGGAARPIRPLPLERLGSPGRVRNRSPQAQAVGHHQERGHRHRRPRHQRVQQARGGQRDRGDVVAESPRRLPRIVPSVARARSTAPTGHAGRRARAPCRQPPARRPCPTRRRCPDPRRRARRHRSHRRRPSRRPHRSLQPLHDADLVVGQGPRVHLLDPGRRRDRPCGGLAVPGQQDRAQPARPQPVDRSPRPVRDRVDQPDDTDDAPASTRTATTVCPVASQSARLTASSAGNPPGRSTATSTPPTTPRAPRPGVAGKSVTSGSGPASCSRVLGTARAIACSDAGSTAPASRNSSTVGAVHAGDLRRRASGPR